MKTLTLAATFAIISVFGSGCGADPEEICAHIEEIVKKEINAEAAKKAVDGCDFKWKMRKDTKGMGAYKDMANCVMEASDIAALGKCK